MTNCDAGWTLLGQVSADEIAAGVRATQAGLKCCAFGVETGCT